MSDQREINRAKLPNRYATCPPALINFKCYDSNNRGNKGACCFTATNLIRELLKKSKIEDNYLITTSAREEIDIINFQWFHTQWAL